MTYSLGIDAGGTYTDVVIIDQKKNIIQTNKSLTTYPLLTNGIKNAIDGLSLEYLKKVSLVSVSTTLATNTILENTGYPVGLIMIGDYEIQDSPSFQYYTHITGGHDSLGKETYGLDIKSAKNFICQVKDKVSAFAVSSYFSVRNPEHEIAIKKAIQEITEMPVVCGHELSQGLGAYERAVTAYLNAQLIPIAYQFINTVINVIEDKGIEARILMLKCDGSVVSIEEALKKPIESIFSGPAASLIGASFLAKKDTCAVIDVGGTSSDVSMIHSSIPELTDEGAKVGGWKTKVRAIKMETSAMGGDSHVWIRNHRIHIGPGRVIPLCRASEMYPSIIKGLEASQHILRSQLGENIQPTRFFMKTGKEPSTLSESEKKLFDMIPDEPVSISDIYWDKNIFPSPMILEKLIKKRLIQAIGFTPTDALHALGEYNEWDQKASLLGADLLAKFAGTEGRELCYTIKYDFSTNMINNIASFVLEGVKSSEIEKILYSNFHAHLNFDIPVILIGGPVGAYVKDVARMMSAEVIVPDHSDVGNAVGAVVAKGMKIITVLIKSSYSESKYSLRPSAWIVFSPEERNEFDTYEDAIKYANECGTRIAIDYMVSTGISPSNVRIKINKNETYPPKGNMPVENSITFVATADFEDITDLQPDT